LIARQSVPRLVIKEEKKPISATAAVEDGISYLCTSCGSEKNAAYSNKESPSSSSSKSPVKMVILVRTDLNMVLSSVILELISLFFGSLGQRKGCCSVLSCSSGCLQDGCHATTGRFEALGTQWTG
jgi:hypothetical protein